MTTAAEVLTGAASWVAGGVPYLWGGVTRAGADCSGFIKALFAEEGTTIPGRTTYQQVTEGAGVDLGPAGNLLANALPGDVLFYGAAGVVNPSHEALYVGGGQIAQELKPGTAASYGNALTSTGLSLEAIRRFTTGTTDPTASADGTTTAGSGTVPSATLTSSSGSGIGSSILRLGVTGAALVGAVALAGLAAYHASHQGGA